MSQDDSFTFTFHQEALYLPPLLELPLPKELVCRHLLIVAESRPLIFVSPVTEYFSRKEEQHILSWFVSFRVRGINNRNWNLQTLAPIEIGLDSTV